jgi:hypothetical protein
LHEVEEDIRDREHYYVEGADSNQEVGNDLRSIGMLASNQDPPSDEEPSHGLRVFLPHSHETDDSISRFLQLPIVPVSRFRRGTGEEPLIDYSKSILMTSDSYIDSLEVLAVRRQDATRAREIRKLEAEARKRRREAEKAEREKRKKHREEERAAKARETTY